MWGSRIFKEAQTAEKRRGFRGTRRRIDRRRERINMLQSLIIEDMEKQYPNFFPMLRETSFDYEDKNISEKLEEIISLKEEYENLKEQLQIVEEKNKCIQKAKELIEKAYEQMKYIH